MQLMVVVLVVHYPVLDEVAGQRVDVYPWPDGGQALLEALLVHPHPAVGEPVLPHLLLCNGGEASNRQYRTLRAYGHPNRMHAALAPCPRGCPLHPR